MHVAIIMDGNGRWATQRGLPRTAGHVTVPCVVVSLAASVCGVQVCSSIPLAQFNFLTIFVAIKGFPVVRSKT